MMKKLLFATAMLLSSAPALASTTIDLSTYTNGDWTSPGEAFYTVPAGTVTLGGTKFAIGDNDSNGTGDYRTFTGSGVQTLTVPVSIFGATTGYTLLNTFWGAPQSGLHTITFNATGGVTQSFDLVGGTDIRDYANNSYTNTVNGTTTQRVFCQDGCFRRLDKQTFALSSAFSNQTLNSVVFTDNGSDGYARMVLTGLSVSAVPEPATWAMMILGFGTVGFALRNRRKQSVRVNFA